MARRGDNIHKRKDGRWEGRYKNGFRTDGSVKYSSVYARSYMECKKKLITAQTSSKIQSIKPSNEILFSDILYRWLNSNRIRLKGATEAKYSNIIESHIIPKLGKIKSSQLDSYTLNLFLEEQLLCGGKKNKAPLSPSYVRTMAIVIDAAINFGVMEGLCSSLRTPINKPLIPKKELTILSRKAEAILTEILITDTSKVALGTLVALQAGLRIGEVCALKWSDVDFINNLLHIRHTVSRVLGSNNNNKTILIIDTPKTEASLRKVPIPSTLRNALLKSYKHRASDYVVSNNENFVGTRTFDYQYRQLLKKYNVQPITFHTLRHTYATRCAEYGLDAKTLSRLLGHSSSSTSLNIYVHPSLDVAMNTVEEIYSST